MLNVYVNTEQRCFQKYLFLQKINWTLMYFLLPFKTQNEDYIIYFQNDQVLIYLFDTYMMKIPQRITQQHKDSYSTDVSVVSTLLKQSDTLLHINGFLLDMGNVDISIRNTLYSLINSIQPKYKILESPDKTPACAPTVVTNLMALKFVKQLQLWDYYPRKQFEELVQSMKLNLSQETEKKPIINRDKKIRKLHQNLIQENQQLQPLLSNIKQGLKQQQTDISMIAKAIWKMEEDLLAMSISAIQQIQQIQQSQLDEEKTISNCMPMEKQFVKIYFQQSYPSVLMLKSTLLAILGSQTYRLKQRKSLFYQKPISCHFCMKLIGKQEKFYQCHSSLNQNSVKPSILTDPQLYYQLFYNTFVKQKKIKNFKHSSSNVFHSYNLYWHYSSTTVNKKPICFRGYCQSCYGQIVLKTQKQGNFSCDFCIGACYCKRCVLFEQILRLSAMYINDGGDIEQLTNGFVFPLCEKVLTKQRKVVQITYANKTKKKNQKIQRKFIDIMLRKGVFLNINQFQNVKEVKKVELQSQYLYSSDISEQKSFQQQQIYSYCSMDDFSQQFYTYNRKQRQNIITARQLFQDDLKNQFLCNKYMDQSQIIQELNFGLIQNQ